MAAASIPTYTFHISHIQTALKCAGGRDCTTDIHLSANVVEYHMMKCLHAMCEPCYKRLKKFDCAPCKAEGGTPVLENKQAFYTSFKSEARDFKSCYYLSKLHELNEHLKKQEAGKCNQCGVQDRTNSWSRCTTCKATICKVCPSIHKPHICSPWISDEGLPGKDPYDPNYLQRGKCNMCLAWCSAYQKDPVFTCGYASCKNMIFCSEDHFSKYHNLLHFPFYGGTLASHPRLPLSPKVPVDRSALVRKNAAYGKIIRGLRNQNDTINSLRVKIDAAEEERRNELRSLQSQSGLEQNGDYIIHLNHYKEGKITEEELLDQLMACGGEERVASIKFHEQLASKFRGEMKKVTIELELFLRAKFHLDLLHFVCCHIPMMEVTAWFSIENVFASLVQNQTNV